jgi:hypothetical protein
MEEGVKARATAIEIGAGSGDFSRGVRGQSGTGRSWSELCDVPVEVSARLPDFLPTLYPTLYPDLWMTP